MSKEKKIQEIEENNLPKSKSRSKPRYRQHKPKRRR